MLKKLRLRFIIVNMALLLAVLLAIFSGIYYLMYKSGENQSRMLMEGLSQSTGFTPGRPHMDAFPNSGLKPPTPYNNAMMRNSFVVKLDNQNAVSAIFSVMSLSTDSELITNAVDSALKGTKEFGIIEINNTEYRYLRAVKPDGKYLIYMDRSMEIATLNNLLFVSLFIGLLSITVLLLLSIFLAKWAVKPIGRAWDKQRQFVADASHELRTPLTIISTNADVVLSNQNASVESQKKWLQYIKSEAERMSKLVNDLLYLAKVDNAEDTFQKTQFDISQMVISACLPFEYMIFEAGMILNMEIPEGVTATGSEERLKQVVIILLDNAMKNTDKDGSISVSLSKTGDKGHITLSVTNTGNEIPVSEKDRIFERFYRVDASRDRHTGGHGLGLSIAKTIVDQHSGTISVTSIGGKTTFTVTLPK